MEKEEEEIFGEGNYLVREGAEVEFVSAVSAGGSVKFLPAV